MDKLTEGAARERGRVRITALKAMQIKDDSGQTLVKVETDSGLAGYGEAGATGPVTRAHLHWMEPMLIGQDPLSIEKLYLRMTTPAAHLPRPRAHRQRRGHGAVGPGGQDPEPAGQRAAHRPPARGHRAVLHRRAGRHARSRRLQSLGAGGAGRPGRLSHLQDGLRRCAHQPVRPAAGRDRAPQHDAQAKRDRRRRPGLRQHPRSARAGL